MANLKVKKEFIGQSTSVPGIGQIKIREDHAAILAQAGRWELLDGTFPNPKKLEPVLEVEEPKEAEPVKETPIKKKSRKNAASK